MPQTKKKRILKYAKIAFIYSIAIVLMNELLVTFTINIYFLINTVIQKANMSNEILDEFKRNWIPILGPAYFLLAVFVTSWHMGKKNAKAPLIISLFSAHLATVYTFLGYLYFGSKMTSSLIMPLGNILLSLGGQKLGSYAKSQKSALFNHLTQRENDVAELITQGLSNLEIANTLFISENTVKNHLSKIYDKLKINSRHALLSKYNANKSL
jgi:DNA-binding CsgD family transcriptional regulator